MATVEAPSARLGTAARLVVAGLGILTAIALAVVYVVVDRSPLDDRELTLARGWLYVEQAALLVMLAIMVIRNLRGPHLSYVANLTTGGAVSLAVVRGMRSHQADAVASFVSADRGDLVAAAEIVALVGALLIVLATLLAAAVREDQDVHLPERQHLETPAAFHALFLLLATRWLVLEPHTANDDDASMVRDLSASWVMFGVVVAIAVVSYAGYRTYTRTGARALLVTGHVATVLLGAFVVIFTRVEIDRFDIEPGFETGVWEVQQSVSTWAAVGISLGVLMVVVLAPVLERVLAPAHDEPVTTA